MVRSIFDEGAEFTSGGYPNAIKATGTADANGIDAYSDNNNAVTGQGNSPNSVGVYGYSEQGIGIIAQSGSQTALYAIGPGTSFGSDTGDLAAIYATGGGTPDGFRANGVTAVSDAAFGVHAIGGGANAFDQVPITQAGVYAQGGSAIGVYATSYGGGAAVSGAGTNGTAGVTGNSDSGIGVLASSTTGNAVQAESASPGNSGVWGNNTGGGVGVAGSSPNGIGVFGSTHTGIGVNADGGSGGVALKVIGKVEIQGNSAGTVHMASGATTLTVTNPAATANSLIFLTPLENPHAFLWVAARTAGHFRIDASTALPSNVTIMFLIIN